MSYDLVVFDPAHAPTEPSAFLQWYGQQSESSYDSSELAGSELSSFFAALCREFPAMNGPHAVDEVDNPKLTEYSFGANSIYMRFAWSQSSDARRAVIELAEKNTVGFYDISDPQGFVWWPPYRS